MAGAGVSLGGLGLIAAGGVLAWSGVNDPPGGPVAAVRDMLQGKLPTAGVQVATQPLPAGTVGSLAGDAVSAATGTGGAGGLIGSLAGQAAGAAVPGAAGAVVRVAMSYLGVPYRWAGASRSGIDCSGLVLVAYRDGAGISLPHLATAQMARGRRVPLDQAQAGDLVGWGAPGNYPHIALAISPTQVVAAPQPGSVVQVQALREAKVSGFGMPDVVRIL